MRKLSLCKLSIIVFINMIYPIKSSFFPLLQNSANHLTPEKDFMKSEQGRIIVSFVACSHRMNEALNMVRSVLLFSLRPVHFVVISDDKLIPQLDVELSRWKVLTFNRLSFELHHTSFPKGKENFWKSMFKPCSTQRLFLPNLLTHIDSMIFADIDTLFLGPVENLWRIFKKFNSSQIMAMAQENESVNSSWYAKGAKHPFYGKTGLNAGVLLMNLTRMRSVGWSEYLLPIARRWMDRIDHDQDIINIVFHHHPEAVFVLDCRFNYRADHCSADNKCASAEKHGAFLLHGTKYSSQNNQPVAYQAIFRTIEEYEVGTYPSKILLYHMEKYFLEIPKSHTCISPKHVYFKVPEQTLKRLYGKHVM